MQISTESRILPFVWNLPYIRANIHVYLFSMLIICISLKYSWFLYNTGPNLHGIISFLFTYSLRLKDLIWQTEVMSQAFMVPETISQPQNNALCIVNAL